MSRWLRTALKQAELDFDSRSTYAVKLAKICDLRSLISKVKDKDFEYIKRSLEKYIYNEGNWEFELFDILMKPIQDFSIDSAFKKLPQERAFIEKAVYDITLHEMIPGTKEPIEPEVKQQYYICLFVSKDKLYKKLSDVVEAITSKLNGIHQHSLDK